MVEFLKYEFNKKLLDGVCVCIQNLEEILLESKLYFAFVSFTYKLNCLDFCCYFFFFVELMSIFFYTVSI